MGNGPRASSTGKVAAPVTDGSPTAGAEKCRERAAIVRTVGVTLRPITDDNLRSVLAVRTTTDQERFVSPVAQSLAEAAECPEADPWFRAAFVDQRPVGFVMVAWDVDPQQPPDIVGPWYLWKLLIDHRLQGQGYGKEVVHEVVRLIRAQGATELLTSYTPGEDGPQGFYARLGFIPTGEIRHDGEVLTRLGLHE
jgi:GNAT superfamily N-acetyltransferase